MPKSDMHLRQRSKNWMLFVILVSLVAIFYALTVVKMSGQG